MARLANDGPMRSWRVYDKERHAHFLTFSCYKRRRLLDVDRAKKIVLGVLGRERDGITRKSAGCHAHGPREYVSGRQDIGRMPVSRHFTSRQNVVGDRHAGFIVRR
jgi:hypothetical protein